MTGWLGRNKLRELRIEEQRFVDAMRPKSKVVLLVPADSPCTNCMQNPGDSMCKNNCSFYLKLLKMRDAGELKKLIPMTGANRWFSTGEEDKK